MDNKEKEEVGLRRKAMRLWLKGMRPRDILKQIARSRPWLYKWQRRYEQGGWAELRSRSRRPKGSAHEYNAQARTVVMRVRRSLQKRQVGLGGARAVQHEIAKHRLLSPEPALATINRWLKAAGLIESQPSAPEAVYYPQSSAAEDTARYLEGGQKVFVFHTMMRKRAPWPRA